MTRILFLIETIYRNIFRSSYGQKKGFLNFFLDFRNVDSILNIWKTKMTVIACVFTNLRTSENVVR